MDKAALFREAIKTFVQLQAAKRPWPLWEARRLRWLTYHAAAKKS